MKVLVLLALVAICAVGLTKAAPSSLNALAEKEDVDQTALLRKFLSSMMMDSNQVAAEQENARAQDNLFAKETGYLKQRTNQREEKAKEESIFPCFCNHYPCPCGHRRRWFGK